MIFGIEGGVVLMHPISPDEIGQKYDKISQVYAKKRSSVIGMDYVDRFLQQLSCKAKWLPLCSVLDIGCGTGVPVTRHLASSGVKVTGLDISEKMLEKAKTNVPEASFVRGDIVTASFDETFDGVFAWDSLFHVPLQHQENVIRKIAGWLNPDGVFLFTAGGDHGEFVSKMFGESFYYSSLSAWQYAEILAEENCRIVFDEIDDPTGGGHRVICCRKNRS